ncbi:dihydrofolate reductase family protein [Streptomyces sp. NPDC048172]|uniref:dihydrofolate reductase family protein n=1 Tax=Streptomyces sp. NPDC048172 TaxID=3365505 RepID=UPI003710C5AD
MRKLVLKMNVSLDGFVGTDSGSVDWIFPSLSDDAAAWLAGTTLWQAGTHIMGRTAYLGMAAHWPTSTEVFAAPMNEIPKVVFSRTLQEADWAGTRIADGDLATEIARLKEEPGKDILAHGGASFARALSSLRLVDEYRLIVHPVALGTGLPLFADHLDLTLLSSTPFTGGTAAHVYRPA